MDEIEKAIDYDKAYHDLADLHMKDEHFRHILSDALRSQQEREKGCEYCRTRHQHFTNCKKYSDYCDLDICNRCKNFAPIHIAKYCDRCGRRLKETQEDGRA